MGNAFVWTLNTVIESDSDDRPIERAVERLQRDMKNTLLASPDAVRNSIVLKEDPSIPAEEWKIEVKEDGIAVRYSVPLGAVFALNHLSEKYLGVQPFWFWLDQKFEPVMAVSVPEGVEESKPYPIRFRGWFINDEILIDHWAVDGNKLLPWEMALEALIRCGGNLCICGTGSNAHRYTPLAREYGLWITHHHAEPLGAEMFARAYPDLKASYALYPDLFDGLWQQAIDNQKGQNVVFSLGFRGQGDIPFWDEDTQYDTPESRGKLISDLIKKQYDMLHATIPDAVCCTNLYGEIMELYKGGYITIPEDVICIWGDNGFGKMVSRRQSNKDERVPALPQEGQGGSHGIYYHASFYDLQAANITVMLPNSVDFVLSELTEAYKRGVHSLLLVNCGNIRAHTYYLDALRRMWAGESTSQDVYAMEYAKAYFAGDHEKEIADLFAHWADAMPAYGKEIDQHAGEQLYSFNVRNLTTQWMTDQKESCEVLWWATGKKPLDEQVDWLGNLCRDGLPAVESYTKRAIALSKELTGEQKLLFEGLILEQANIILHSMRGCVEFQKGFHAAKKKDWMLAFYAIGLAAEEYDLAEEALRAPEYGKWIGFGEGECYNDCRYTAHLLRILMGWLRAFGEGPYYYEWQWQLAFGPEDRRIRLMSNLIRRIDDAGMMELMRTTPYRDFAGDEQQL